MYVDNNHNEFESYEAACRYYGVETPEQIRAEEQYYAELDYIDGQDDLEIRGPLFGRYRSFREELLDDEMPF